MRDDDYYHNDGSRERLLCAEGTIPIEYNGARYNIPVKMYAPSDYPTTPPTCFVTPTRDMVVKPNHGCVESDGMVAIERVFRWDRRRKMSDVARALSDVFSAEPPLFSKPARGVGNAGEATQRTATASTAETRPERVPFSVSVERRPSLNERFAQGQRATTSPRADDATAAQAWFRQTAIQSLTDRLKSGTEHHLDANAQLIETLLAHQTELYARKINLEQEKGVLRLMCDQFERDAQELRGATATMERWLEAHPDTGEVSFDPETAIEAADAMSRQLLNAHAKDAAIEDALDALDELLNDGKVQLEDYMRQVNKLCKEQFIARAEILVVSRMQQERGVTNGLAPRDDGAESPRDVDFDFLRPRPPQSSPPPRETRKPPPSWNSNSNSNPTGWWDC